jgi:hypothetical protein
MVTPDGWSDEPYGAVVYSMSPANVFATVVDGVVRYRAGDATVGGLKPSAEECARGPSASSRACELTPRP